MIESARIAGWRDSGGGWNNVEAGDPEPTDADLAASNRIVVAIDDTDGETHYLTTSHLTDDYGIDDYLADVEADDASYDAQFV